MCWYCKNFRKLSNICHSTKDEFKSPIANNELVLMILQFFHSSAVLTLVTVHISFVKIKILLHPWNFHIITDRILEELNNIACNHIMCYMLLLSA